MIITPACVWEEDDIVYSLDELELYDTLDEERGKQTILSVNF